MDTLGSRAAKALKDAKVKAQHEGRTLSWDEVAAIIDGCANPPPPVTLPTTEGKAATVEAVYALYPRKVGKLAACKAITKAVVGLKDREPDPLAYLLERTKLYSTAVSMWSEADRQYVPHCATWFNRGSYDDNPREWERSAPAQVNGRDYSKL